MHPWQLVVNKELLRIRENEELTVLELLPCSRRCAVAIHVSLFLIFTITMHFFL